MTALIVLVVVAASSLMGYTVYAARKIADQYIQARWPAPTSTDQKKARILKALMGERFPTANQPDPSVPPIRAMRMGYTTSGVAQESK